LTPPALQGMAINVLASVAVRDLKLAPAWYEQLFGRPGRMLIPNMAEWKFARGGRLQVYQSPESDEERSFTLGFTHFSDGVKKTGAVKRRFHDHQSCSFYRLSLPTAIESASTLTDHTLATGRFEISHLAWPFGPCSVKHGL
jgi:hypothetical protein